MRFSVLTAAATLLATASAHGGVDVYTVGTTAYQGYTNILYSYLRARSTYKS